MHPVERGRRINEKQTSGPPDWTSQEHAGRKGPERAAPHAGSAAVRPGPAPTLAPARPAEAGGAA